MNRRTQLVFFGLVAGAAACGDVVGPRSDAAHAPAGRIFVGGVMSASLSRLDTTRFDITIDPTKQSTIYLGGGNNLVFPTNAVCDLTKSHYGEGQWDKPCHAAQSPITVSVKSWLDGAGHPRVDFSPNMRFVPSDLPSRWVRITFIDKAAALSLGSKILYAQNEHAPGKDESSSDATMATVRDPVTGELSCRIKHFSGYLVGAGDDSSAHPNLMPKMTPMPSPTLAPSSTPLNRVSYKASASGYILVSG